MFSVTFLKSGARAFTARSNMVWKQPEVTTTAATISSKCMPATPSVVRLFMSNTQEPDTTVVDVCTAKIKQALETDNVKVVGAYDDPNGSHISVEVVSAMFQGKRPVQRQQLVYKAIWEELQGPVHAVDNMICKTPDE
ncbi:BolA-like protein [Nitzschia inconspicua]|uniref:BolA-like protein n=1 Tax=Nitzschia inconspicua TaxID=303405 RepID=A0A9K3K4U8_9STRA|nr:BolA-like protein [Nitzschia inconspicua]KAG7358294.1 BolA-like protein [Nitzschia inconspicua]